MWSEFLLRLSSGNSEFPYDDVSDWSTEDFEALTAMGLLHEIERAAHLSCDACPEAHWERVRWSEDGKRAFIPCPLVGTADVILKRLRRWRIDMERPVKPFWGAEILVLCFLRRGRACNVPAGAARRDHHLAGTARSRQGRAGVWRGEANP
jgi:hypothetical protein